MRYYAILWRTLAIYAWRSKHYCTYLEPFKQLSVVFEFWVNGQRGVLGLRPLILTDLVVPGDKQKQIPACDKSYAIDKIIGKVRQALSESKKRP